MSSAGFRRSGRTFTYAAEDGGLVMVKFAPWSSGDKVKFHIDYVIIPAIIGEYCGGAEWSRRPEWAWGVLITRLEVPEDLRDKEYLTSLWSFRPSDLESIGKRLQRILESEAIPRWRSFLDPQGLLDALRNPTSEIRGGSRHGGPLMTEAFLTVDDGDAKSVERLLDEAEETYVEDKRIDWLRERLRRRLGQN